MLTAINKLQHLYTIFTDFAAADPPEPVPDLSQILSGITPIKKASIAVPPKNTSTVQHVAALPANTTGLTVSATQVSSSVQTSPAYAGFQTSQAGPGFQISHADAGFQTSQPGSSLQTSQNGSSQVFDIQTSPSVEKTDFDEQSLEIIQVLCL